MSLCLTVLGLSLLTVDVSPQIVPAVAKCLPTFDFEDGFSSSWLQLPAASWQLISNLSSTEDTALVMANSRIYSRLQNSLHFQYTGEKQMCRLTFNYQLWGAGSSLNVRVSTSTNYLEVWADASRAQSFENRWKSADITLPRNLLSLFQVIFAGQRSSALDDSGVAIDNIALQDCCLTACHDKSGFDHGWDGWESSLGTLNQLLWHRNKGETQTANTGPSQDVSGQGYYLYMEASDVQTANSSALLSSPIFLNKVTSAQCWLSLRFHMFGSTMGSLSLAIRTSTDWTAIHQVWTEKGDHGRSWMTSPSLQLPLNGARYYQVLITAVRGAGYQSDVAIDEIEITDHCSCPYVSDTSMLPTPGDDKTTAATNNATEERLQTAVIILSVFLSLLLIIGIAVMIKLLQPHRLLQNKKRSSSKSLLFSNRRPSGISPPLGLPSVPAELETKSRRSTRSSWRMSMSPSGKIDEVQGPTLASETSEHIEITESLLDLMETGDTGTNTPRQAEG